MGEHYDGGMNLHFDVVPTSQPVPADQRNAILADPGFGQHFTDHMARATWTEKDGWHDSAVVAMENFSLHPASAVLHYAQEIFEGLKAYRHDDGSIWTFRPDRNAARFRNSARRLNLPELPEVDFIASIDALVAEDRQWVPAPDGEYSLYVRPFMVADEIFLGVRSAHRVLYGVITCPVGSYFASGGITPVDIWVAQKSARSGPGGTGDAKCGGNYAASLLATAEAYEQDCSQVLFLDAVERRYLDELGGMNIMLVTADDELLTPCLGTILPGVTRESLLTLAPEFGLRPVERQITLEETIDGLRSGHITEAFACGTAAVITPIGSLKDPSGQYRIADGQPGERTVALRQHMLDIQFGRVEDTHGWLHRVC